MTTSLCYIVYAGHEVLRVYQTKASAIAYIEELEASDTRFAQEHPDHPLSQLHQKKLQFKADNNRPYYFAFEEYLYS